MTDYFTGSSLDEEPQIDLTPLIDCLFMLIIFWIGTYKAGQPLYLKEGSFSLSKPLAIWC